MCSPEVSDIQDWSSEYSSEDVVFLGIDVEEPVIFVETFIQQTGWTHPVVLDQLGAVYDDYQLDGNISPFPLDYIVDRNGIVAYGKVDYDPIGMRIVLDLLLSECEPPDVVTCNYLASSSEIQIRFNAPVSGSYLVWKTTNPNHDGNPNGGADPDWVFVGTVNVLSAGNVSYLISGALDSFACFVVTQDCN